MRRILLGLIAIVGAGSALYVGSTGAFFSDTETSTGNTFAAGAIDLLIDNDSYYNGVASPNTSWELVDLPIEKFFNFLDVKPDDYGEDTISIHVDTNDAYLCAEVTLTNDDENGCNEPESLEDNTCDDPGPTQGELADIVNFIWWADDGDNVLEDDENVISSGPLGALVIGDPFNFALADSATNIWEDTPGPIDGDTTYYIGKAWCFGFINGVPLIQDGVNNVRNPSLDNDGVGGAGQPEDGGFACQGEQLDNDTQTDSVVADVSFSAVQARNNPNFLCVDEPVVNPATLTLVKSVNNNGEGAATGAEWTLTATGPTKRSGISGTPAGTSGEGNAGAYVLGEQNGVPGYGATQYSCVINGNPAVVSNNINLAPNDVATCTVTNTLNLCSAANEWADSVIGGDQGKRKNGTPILAARTDPTKILGPAETAGLPSDVVPPGSTFYSLGFNVGTTSTRSATVSFLNNVIVNGPGADVRIYEVTGGVYPDETATIEASQDGISWTTLVPNAIRDEDLDLGSLAWAKFIRVVDITPLGTFEAEADGYDLDAVRALNCAAIPQ